MLSVALVATVASAASASTPSSAAARAELRKKVSFEFEDTPLWEALSSLQMMTRLNFVLDASAPREKREAAVSMKVENVTVEQALRKMLGPAGLHYGIVEGTVFVSTPEKVAAEVRRSGTKGRSAEATGTGLGKRISVELVDTPLTEALDFLARQGGLDIILDPRARRERGQTPINLRGVSDMPLRVVLDWVLKLADLRYSVRGNRVFVSM